jgi:hypothetical protein
VSANVSKKISNFFCVVAANDLAESLLFLGFEEEGSHLGFVHFGTSGGSSHAAIISSGGTVASGLPLATA